MKPLFKQLKNIIKDMDKVLLMFTISMFVFGLLNIVTASSREAVIRYEFSLYHYFFQQLKMLTVGVFLSLFILNIPTKKYYKLAGVAFFVALFLCIYLSISGNELKGAKNWLSIFGFTFQPSEISKPVMIVCLAILFEKFNKKLKNKTIDHFEMIAIILFVGLIIPILIFFQKDLGTMLIMMITFGVMFLYSPILKQDKIKTMGLLFGLAILGAFVMIGRRGYIFSEAQMARFNFFAPCSNYETGGYQTCNGFIALNDGGLFGLGIGKSKQKYSYIPEPHTDSVFAIIGEEYGVLKSSLIFIAYIIILKRILKIASKSDTIRGKYICLGVATYIFSHIFINLGGLFGIIPLTGVPLPFLSYGGTYAISLLCSLAVVQRVHIEIKNMKIKI